MAEEKEEKKKPGIAKRIFKWISLGLLILLLIAGLIFQAPWKVTVLLIIFLLACTLLPKPARKWFWLSVGVIIIALIIWIFLPDDNEGWRPYTFDEELAALEAKRAIPDSENAAIIYNELLEIDDEEDEYEPNFVDDNSYDLTRSEPWLSKDHPEIAEWLKYKKSIIETLMQASQKDACRFPINPDMFDTEQTNRYLAMRRWAYLLIRAANNDVGEGRINHGLEKYIAVLQMAKHLYQQPTTIEMLVGIAIETLALRQFNRFVVIGNATEERLALIEETVAEIKHDWSSDLPNFLEHDRLLMKNLISMFYEVNPKGKVRLSLDPTAVFRAQFPEDVPPLTYWQRKLTKAGTILGWFFVPSTPQKAAKIIDESFQKYYAMTEPDFDWQKEPRRFSLTSAKFNYRCMVDMLLYIMEPAHHRIHDLYLRVTSDQRGSRLMIALRRYKNKNGTWPQTLDEIEPLAPAEIFVDPFNNGPFVYKLTDDSFMLYSKGMNNIDEKGEYNYDYEEEKAEPDDWLIWPPRTGGCETEEENTDDEQQ